MFLCRTKAFNFFADCTNFVSQIKRAGGVPRCIKYSGGNDIRINWSTSWHCIPKEDKYSTVWVNANAFVRFFGVKYSTKSFISFADNVKKGSFVSFDRTDDGELWEISYFHGKESKEFAERLSALEYLQKKIDIAEALGF